MINFKLKNEEMFYSKYLDISTEIFKILTQNHNTIKNFVDILEDLFFKSLLCKEEIYLRNKFVKKIIQLIFNDNNIDLFQKLSECIIQRYGELKYKYRKRDDFSKNIIQLMGNFIIIKKKYLDNVDKHNADKDFDKYIKNFLNISEKFKTKTHNEAMKFTNNIISLYNKKKIPIKSLRKISSSGNMNLKFKKNINFLNFNNK